MAERSAAAATGAQLDCKIPPASSMDGWITRLVAFSVKVVTRTVARAVWNGLLLQIHTVIN